MEQSFISWKRKALEKQTFCGCGASEDSCRIMLFGAPFDGATSFRPGARFAPQSMRNDSYGLETYSPGLDRDLSEISVCDLGDLELPAGASPLALEHVEEAVGQILDAGKIPVMIGGDHSMSIGAIRAAAARFQDLHVIHLDAHTDLRDEFFGDPLSHACVIRRAHDILGDGRIHAYGIRSGVREEFVFGHEHLDFHAFSLADIALLGESLGNLPVYVTLDLDVMDPSVFPGTGTPEPGGATFPELLHALSLLGRLNVIGADLMELSPPCDLSGVSTIVACKILREWLLMIQ